MKPTTNLFNSNLAEIEVSYKTKVKPSERRKITCSRDLSEIATEIFNADTIEFKEEFIIVCLNRANKVLGWVKVSEGGMSGTVVDPKIIFSIALKTAASSIVLMHNHPSGNVKPSEADIRLTRNLSESGKMLEISVIDHLIVTPTGEFYSFADEGML